MQILDEGHLQSLNGLCSLSERYQRAGRQVELECRVGVFEQREGFKSGVSSATWERLVAFHSGKYPESSTSFKRLITSAGLRVDHFPDGAKLSHTKNKISTVRALRPNLCP
jgi:hypothetical protein